MSVSYRSPVRPGSTERARPLTSGECRDWLASHREGRLGYATGRGPRSVVVNYQMSGEHIMFRLPDYNDIVHYAPGERVTLEVQGVHSAVGDFETVSVTGQAELAGQHATQVPRTEFDEEWPPGVRTSVICLPMTEVNGFEHGTSSLIGA